MKIGDALLYEPSGNTLGLMLGYGIRWEQWIDGHENVSKVHAALFYGIRVPLLAGEWIVRQNPGGPAFETADSQPWDKIETRRLYLDGVWPGDDPVWVRFFDEAVNRHFQDGYAYGQIGDYAAEDLLARLGMGVQSAELRKHAALFLDRHYNVCSEFDRVVIQEATDNWRKAKGTYTAPYNALPGVGEGQGRPADWDAAPDLKTVPVANPSVV